jgi:hypothetical protein
MLVHELCGISEENADRIEMIVRDAIKGRRMDDANDIVLKTILGSEDCFKEAIYMAFAYGFVSGMFIQENIQKSDIDGVE